MVIVNIGSRVQRGVLSEWKTFESDKRIFAGWKGG